jgi:hypothetical protein
MLVKMRFEDLRQVAPDMVAEFENAMDAAVKDCYGRPSPVKSRKIVFEMEVEPVLSDGKCDCVASSFTVTSKLPASQSRVYQMVASPNGAILVNPASPSNVRQGTLDQVDPDTGELRPGQ